MPVIGAIPAFAASPTNWMLAISIARSDASTSAAASRVASRSPTLTGPSRASASEIRAQTREIELLSSSIPSLAETMASRLSAAASP